MKIIAHRGLSKMAPENSLEAIVMAQDLGIDAIEIDVRRTKDDQLVVFHDASLRRLRSINKQINSYKLDELLKVKLRSGVSIPSLKNVIDIVNENTLLLIEGKGNSWAELLSEELKKYSKSHQFRVISFNFEELSKFKKISPEIDCYVITPYLRNYKAIKLALKYKFDGVIIFYAVINSYIFRLAKKNNLGLCIYTLNNSVIAKRIHRLFNTVDIITDQPAKIRDAIFPDRD